MNHDVFISYSSKDQKVVEALSHYLEERGIRCFVAYRDIPKGKVWATVIAEAIENCQMMVVVFSKDFNISEQVDREIELCADEKKPILTFRIQDEAFKGAKKFYLKNLNWIDAFPNPNECFQYLYESIGKLLKIEIKQAVITKIEQPKFIIREENKNINSDIHGFVNLKKTINGVSFELIAVKGGSFQMGSNESDDKKPIHQVTVSDFYIGKYAVTQKQWQAIMGNNPSRFKGKKHPVENVSWFDAVAFCNELSEAGGLDEVYKIKNDEIELIKGARGYRLPTEAEWEFACRGGIQSGGYEYAGSNILDEVAEYEGNNNMTTKPVGGKKPNELGLYDMSGNVEEWCQDRYYKVIAQSNPDGFGFRRVCRGGSFSDNKKFCQVAARLPRQPECRSNDIGFRVVLGL